MRDFVFFLGRFHVLVLHLPIAIILAAVALDWLAMRERYRALAAAAPFLWGTAAISAVASAALGYMHFAEGGFTGPDAIAHRLYGTSVAAVALLVWWLVSPSAVTAMRHARAAATVVLLVLLTLTGHYGGNLTHGSTYLVEYAPEPLRGWASTERETGAQTRSPAAAAADPELVARLGRAGLLARAVSETDAQLRVAVYSPGREVDAETLSTLFAAADRIVELNLQDAGIDDADLVGFERFTELTRLRLSNGRVTDAGLGALERLPKLEHLNLYGNRGVTDAGLATLGSIASLRELHLWQTGVTEEAAARLREQRPELRIELGVR